MSKTIPERAYNALAPKLRDWIAELGWKREELEYINTFYRTTDKGKVADVSVRRADVVESRLFAIAEDNKQWRTQQ